MARRSLLYFLFSEKKLPLYEDENGHILEGNENLQKPDGQPAHLKYSPEGWKDTLVKYARNIQYWGMFRNYTAPMKFVKDGAKILHRTMWALGIEAICYFGILRLNRTTLPYNYEITYLSDINFSKFKKNKRGVNIEAMEGGLSKLLKANESTVYEIPVDTDEQHIDVLMDGMEFDFNRNLGVVPEQKLYAVPNYYLGLVETSREGNTTDVLFQDILPKQSSPYPNEDWFLHFDKVTASASTLNFRIHGRVKMQFNEADTFVLRVEVNDSEGSGSTQYDLINITGSPRTAGTIEWFDVDETFPVPSGSRAHMKIFTGSNTGSLLQLTVLEGELLCDYVYRYKSTYVKALYPYRLLEKIIEKMTNGVYGIQSSWLSAFKSIAITCGDALRGIVTDNSDPDNPVKGAVIKTSLLEFFKAMNRWGAGLGIEGVRATVDDKLLFERFAYFFQSSILADIGEVSNAELIVAEDIMFNTINAGYEKQDYSDANGRYEMNQGQTWTTPGTKIVRELNLKSPYRADAFGIELLRINYEQKKTSDSSSDNDNFFLNITEDNTSDPGAFSGEVTGVHSYSGTSNVIYDNVTTGPLFTANASKDEFTYNGSAPQTILFSLSIKPTGGGGVTNINVAIIKNGVPVSSALLPVGATNGITSPVSIVSGDILSVQVGGMAGALNVNEGTVSFSYDVPGIYELYRPAYTAISGIPHPDSAFNTELTPKKSILENGAYIRSVLDLQDGSLIKFSSADKNSEFSTTLGGVTVTEKEDIQIGTLPDRLFRPYYITFTTKVPVNLMALIKANPYGKIRFTVDGEIFYGFLFDGGIKIGMQDTQVWKVLSAPENDLLKFNNE